MESYIGVDKIERGKNNFTKRTAKTNDEVLFENLYPEKETRRNQTSI